MRIFCPNCGEKLPDEAVGLTPGQYRTLEFIADFIDVNGHSPSYAEIMCALDIVSTSGAHRYVKGLLDRGAITQLRHLARSIKLTESGREALEQLEPHQRAVHGGERAA